MFALFFKRLHVILRIFHMIFAGSSFFTTTTNNNNNSSSKYLYLCHLIVALLRLALIDELDVLQ
jgi:hypothetical protein